MEADAVNTIISNGTLGALLVATVFLLVRSMASEREAWRKRVEDAQRYIAELRAQHEAAQTRADAFAAAHLELVKENTASTTALTQTLEELRRDLRRRPSEPG